MSSQSEVAASSIDRSNRAALVAWIPPLLWIAMIAFGGGQSLGASRTIVWLSKISRTLHLQLSWQALSTLNFVLRKTGHFSVYAVLSFLLFRAWRASLGYARDVWSARASVVALACSVIVASLDEFHQSFSPGRTPAVHDVVLDTFGAIFAQMLLLVFLIHRRKPSPD